ncbi:hypothetical protein DID88_003956 [Monilinia fructigena]|uniref:Amino acid permease/ SLC12A domain-containing protein n=1 Tax=Monilinia fructigena TaxID=38457 RepID=A0A395IEH4_9HELO|nr:hypothetical protein DID88_003956 [Monilinia fructigena]
MPQHADVDADAAQLAAHGHKQELERNFSLLSMLGLAFAILNSWTALAASLSVALPSGGPTSVLWGLITAGVCNLCLAVSLSEFLSAYPTAGGQYHWVAVISWKKYVPILSWITGWINVSGWIALVASGWPDGVAWLLGLLQAGLGLTGFDAVAHMIEEIPNPGVQVQES